MHHAALNRDKHMSEFSSYIHDIPNYPEEGVVFKDITPLLKDPQAFISVIDTIAKHYEGKGITKILGAEARGFIFGAPLAYRMGAGFVPARKPGKLPRETISVEYALEYGTDKLEIHADALNENDVVLIVDDVLATGGTACAQVEMCRRSKAQLAGFAFLLELDFLGGRARIEKTGDFEVFSLEHVS